VGKLIDFNTVSQVFSTVQIVAKEELKGKRQNLFYDSIHFIGQILIPDSPSNISTFLDNKKQSYFCFFSAKGSS
jgi:hypothetical protein